MSRIISSQKFFEMMSSALASWRMESSDSPILRMALQIEVLNWLLNLPVTLSTSVTFIWMDAWVLGANDMVPQHIQIHELSGVLHVEWVSRALYCPPCPDTSPPSFTDSFKESQCFLQKWFLSNSESVNSKGNERVYRREKDKNKALLCICHCLRIFYYILKFFQVRYYTANLEMKKLHFSVLKKIKKLVQ